LYDYPLSWEFISTFPADKIICELKEIDKTKKASVKNYKEYIDALVGPTLHSMFFARYSEKIWGISTDSMTANWAPKRVNIYKKRHHFLMTSGQL
jgi:UDP-galactopyranose mutase